MANGAHPSEPSPYLELEREAWAALGRATEQPLSPDEIDRVRGLGDELDLEEVQQVYLPLSGLLSLYVKAAGSLHRRQEELSPTQLKSSPVCLVEMRRSRNVQPRREIPRQLDRLSPNVLRR